MELHRHEAEVNGYDFYDVTTLTDPQCMFIAIKRISQAERDADQAYVRPAGIKGVKLPEGAKITILHRA
jgi:hypothetical protein